MAFCQEFRPSPNFPIENEADEADETRNRRMHHWSESFFSLALHSSRLSLFLVRDISFHGGLELLAPVGLMVPQKPYVWDEVVKRCTDVVLGNEIFSLLRSILISFLILQAGPLLYYHLLFSLFYFLSYSFFSSLSSHLVQWFCQDACP